MTWRLSFDGVKYQPGIRCNAKVARVTPGRHPPSESPDGGHPKTMPLYVRGHSDGMQQTTHGTARPFNSVGTRGADRRRSIRLGRVEFDGFIPVSRVRSNPKKWGSRPCGTPYRWDPTLALVVRCHPIARWTPNSDHAMRHIFGDQSSHEDCSRQPPTLTGW